VWSANATESGDDYTASLVLAHAGHLVGWLGWLGLVSHSGGPAGSIIQINFQLFNMIQIANYETGTSRIPKISKLCMVIAYIIMDNFHFSQLPIPSRF
jgi:hypothetical protein